MSNLVTIEEAERTFLNIFCVSGFQNAPFSGPVLCNIHLHAVYRNILNDLGICYYSVSVPSKYGVYWLDGSNHCVSPAASRDSWWQPLAFSHPVPTRCSSSAHWDLSSKRIGSDFIRKMEIYGIKDSQTYVQVFQQGRTYIFVPYISTQSPFLE